VTDPAPRVLGFALDDLDALGDSLPRYLERAWKVEHETDPADFDEDLTKLRPIFQSHVTGNRVRDHIKTLGRIPGSRPFLPDALFLPVDADRGMVTPEGRAILEVARARAHDRSADLTRISGAVAEFYGGSLRSWLSKAVETGLVPLPSIGFVLFLLINGSIGEQRAMRFPNQKDEEADLAGVVMDVASTFSSHVHGPTIKPKERMQLRTSWVVSQAVRHLGAHIARDSDKKAGLASIWVEGDRIDSLLQAIAVAIHARGHAEHGDVAIAFDAALSVYDGGRVLLGAWGISHERRRQTQHLRENLLAAFDRTRAQ
jgi:hypothetical protein